MASSEQIDKLIAEQSAEWTEKLAQGKGRELKSFAEWSRKSPQHVRHFLMMMALEQELRQLDPQRQLEIPAVAGSVIPLGARQSTEARSLRWRRWTVAAAILVAVGLMVPLAWHLAAGRLAPSQEFTTAVGEQRAVELPDGSILHLNTQSRAKLRFSTQARDIELLAGEALFKVRRDAARPFRVHAGHVVVQALGTQFNVYTQRDGTKVAVVEGRVQVSSDKASTVRLKAGEETHIDATGKVDTRHAVEVASIAAWRQRRLVFDQRPLFEVVEEFNRYNQAPRFKIASEAVAGRPYSGAFDADDPESLAQLLELDSGLRVERRGEEIWIQDRD